MLLDFWTFNLVLASLTGLLYTVRRIWQLETASLTPNPAADSHLSSSLLVVSGASWVSNIDKNPLAAFKFIDATSE